MSDSEVGEGEAEADPMRAAAKPHPFPNFSPVSPSSSDDGEEKNKAAAAVAPAPPEHAAAGNRQQRHAATSDDHGAASDDEFPTPALGDGMRESLTTRLGKCTWQPLPCSETVVGGGTTFARFSERRTASAVLFGEKTDCGISADISNRIACKHTRRVRPVRGAQKETRVTRLCFFRGICLDPPPRRNCHTSRRQTPPG